MNDASNYNHKHRNVDSKSPNLREYWEDRLKDNLGLQGVGFIGLGKSYNKWLYRVRRKVFTNNIKSLHVNLLDKEIVDIGCGTGFYIQLWKNMAKSGHIAGMDITKVAIQNLKGKYSDVELNTADISSEADLQVLGYTNRFDIVSAFDVLFHITDDAKFEQAIKNIYSIMKPNGYFIFSDNFIHGDEIRSAYQVSRPLSKIEKILVENGFEIIRRKPMFVLMNAPVDTTRQRAKRRWKALTMLLKKGETIGFMLGCILYPLEVMLVTISKETASTEIMTCRKIK